jgi:hypothetical protein
MMASGRVQVNGFEKASLEAAFEGASIPCPRRSKLARASIEAMTCVNFPDFSLPR